MEYLYHYTTLSSLALILKNKTIRFNSLINMDDAEEVQTKNSPFLGKYCFVSSWTNIQKENIPFWGLYTQGVTGVRIRLQKYPFELHTASLPYFEDGKPFQSYIPEDLFQRKDIFLYPTLPFLRAVEYTNNDALIYPEPIQYIQPNPNGSYNIGGIFNDLNRYKRDVWAFQSEWRYGFILFPHDNQGNLYMDLRKNATDLPFSHYDVPIVDSALEDIEITIGPKMNDGDRILLNLLCEKYCPKAVIQKSTLQIN